jgi:hypothetical protein
MGSCLRSLSRLTTGFQAYIFRTPDEAAFKAIAAKSPEDKLQFVQV